MLHVNEKEESYRKAQNNKLTDDMRRKKERETEEYLVRYLKSGFNPRLKRKRSTPAFM